MLSRTNMENATNTSGAPDLGANNFGATNNAFGGDAPMSVGPPSNNFNALSNNNNNNFNTPNNNFDTPLNFGNNSGAPKGISFNPALASKQLEKSGVLVSQTKPVPRLAFWLAITIAAIFLVGLVVVLVYFLTAKPSCASCVITGVPPAGPDAVNWIACNKDQCQGTAAITGTGTFCAVFGGVTVNPGTLQLQPLNGDKIRAALTASTGIDPGPDNTWTEFAAQCVNNACVGFSHDATSNTYYPCLANPNGSSVATIASGGTVPTGGSAGHMWTIVTS